MYETIRRELAYDGSGETSGIRAGARPLFDCCGTQPRTLSVPGRKSALNYNLHGTYNQALIQVESQSIAPNRIL